MVENTRRGFADHGSANARHLIDPVGAVIAEEMLAHAMQMGECRILAGRFVRRLEPGNARLDVFRLRPYELAVGKHSPVDVDRVDNDAAQASGPVDAMLCAKRKKRLSTRFKARDAGLIRVLSQQSNPFELMPGFAQQTGIAACDIPSFIEVLDQ